MGNSFCNCQKIQKDEDLASVRLLEASEFSDEEKQRILDEDIIKQAALTSVYEDILREIDEEKESERMKYEMVAERLSKEEAEADRLIMDEINQKTKTLEELEKVKTLKNNENDKIKTIDPIIAVVKQPEMDSEIKDEVFESVSSVLDHKSSDVSLTPSLSLDVDHMPDTDTEPFLFDIVFNQSAKQPVGISVAACKVAYINSSGIKDTLDCCVLTASTLTTHCKEGDLIIRVNKKECISTAPLPAGSLLVSGGVKGFVKDVNKKLNRTKGNRRVRFLRSPRLSSTIKKPLKESYSIELSEAEISLLIKDRDQCQAEIYLYTVENESKERENFRDSMSRTFSMSPVKLPRQNSLNTPTH